MSLIWRILALATAMLVSTGAQASLRCEYIFSQTRDAQEVQNIFTQFLREKMGIEDVRASTHKKFLGLAFKHKWLETLSQSADQSRDIEKYYRSLQRLRPQSQIPYGIEAQWVDRVMFSQGIKQILELNLTPQEQGKITSAIRKMINHRALRLLFDPVSLMVKDKTIPQDLLEKIILDGADAHQREIAKVFKTTGQNKQEVWRRLHVATQIVTALVLAVVMVDDYHQVQDDIARAQGEAFVENLDAMILQLDQLEKRLEAAGRLKPAQ